MAAPLTASMPQFTQLGYNTTVVLEALDPTTGDPVDGVSVASVEIWADVEIDTAGPTSLLPVVGPYMLIGGPAAGGGGGIGLPPTPPLPPGEGGGTGGGGAGLPPPPPAPPGGGGTPGGGGAPPPSSPLAGSGGGSS